LMHRFTVWVTAFAALVISAGATSAMQFTLVREPGLVSELVSINATGEIEAGDVEAFANVLDQYFAGDAPVPHPTVSFDSPGGDPVIGLDLSRLIRALELPTHVPPGAVCASACTIAFIGGVRRTVLGDFLIHAASAAADVSTIGSEDLRDLLNGVQALGTALIANEREMLGSTNMTEMALAIPSEQVLPLDDAQLRDWHVISYAMRPSQRFTAETGPLSKCGDNDWVFGQETEARIVLCHDDLRVARDAVAVEAAVARLSSSSAAEQVMREQPLFEAAWESCESTRDLADPYWRDDIATCVRAAFTARLAELQALITYYDVRTSDPALKWTRPKPE